MAATHRPSWHELELLSAARCVPDRVGLHPDPPRCHFGIQRRDRGGQTRYLARSGAAPGDVARVRSSETDPVAIQAAGD